MTTQSGKLTERAVADQRLRYGETITARCILDALIARADDNIWASEVHFYDHEVDSRVDFWTMEPARSKGFRTSSYEIKVSRSDFQRDSEKKQDAALRWSDRFWYVTPPAMLRTDEVPPWAGLMTWDGERFGVVKKPPRREKADPTWEVIVTILRNSGDCRRDIGLLNAQLVQLKAQATRHRSAEQWRNKRHLDRLLRRSANPPTTTKGER